MDQGENSNYMRQVKKFKLVVRKVERSGNSQWVRQVEKSYFEGQNKH